MISEHELVIGTLDDFFFVCGKNKLKTKFFREKTQGTWPQKKTSNAAYPI